MSRAFVKEDVDPPERSGRVRSPSGLPPGTTNYITGSGAERLRRKLAQLREDSKSDREQLAHLEQTLASVTVVETDVGDGQSVSFGARVTLDDAAGESRTYRIVGVEELGFYTDAVSWVSSIGRTLLAAERGDRVVLDDAPAAKVVKIEYPAD